MPTESPPYRVVYLDDVRTKLQEYLSVLQQRGFKKQELADCLLYLENQMSQDPIGNAEPHFQIRGGILICYIFSAPIGFEYGIIESHRVVVVRRIAISPPP
jgi:hypothetical protein